jgi:2-polyprenyl-6-hydroxyphenyl methylase/3-demethylubiquinone-9 3-methyltransferase
MGTVAAPQHAREVESGERFEFGRNWARFLASVDDRRIASAEASLEAALGPGSLAGKSFLDVGSGSGLFSLAARRLGATVRSFDYDPESVACTRALRQRYRPGDDGWSVEEGSILDEAFVARLGTHDVVYSWGVLHHTGAMWKAVDHAARLVAPGGRLFIALYNDQGGASRRWTAVKRGYNRGGRVTRAAITGAVCAFFEARNLAIRLVRFRERRPPDAARHARGMSKWTDLVDWVGGWPFEVSRPEEVFRFLKARGFALDHLTTAGGGLGCNEFVFTRRPG